MTKVLANTLLMLLLCLPMHAIDQSLTLRIGGSVDRNLGQSYDTAFKGISGGLGLGLVYDLFPLPMISLSPELHAHFFRKARAYSPDFLLGDTSYQQVMWHEVALGMQVKLNLAGMLWAGVGAGVHFSLSPHQASHALSISSSYAPYFVIELGRTVYLLARDTQDARAEVLVGMHFALRFSGNIAAWNHLPASGHFQNNYSIGLFVGATISHIAWPLI